MEKKEKKGGANIGSASLILIFIVMCLGTFGLLSLSSAGNDRTLSERNAAAVSAYYTADLKAAKVSAQIGRAADSLRTEGQAGQGTFPGLYEAEEIAASVDSAIQVLSADSGTLTFEVPMANSQALHVELTADSGADSGLTVSQWRVVSSEDFAIDQRMPVWDGN